MQEHDEEKAFNFLFHLKMPSETFQILKRKKSPLIYILFAFESCSKQNISKRKKLEARGKCKVHLT